MVYAAYPKLTPDLTSVRRDLAGVADDQEVESISLGHDGSGALDNVAAAVNAPVAWNLGLNGSGVGVAVIDSGILPVQDLQNNPRIVYNELHYG
jgi:subtilisin family serine protease